MGRHSSKPQATVPDTGSRVSRPHARPAAVPESAFVTVADTAVLTEALCVQEERVVDRANTASWGPGSLVPCRRHKEPVDEPPAVPLSQQKRTGGL